jgi:hypothetical protein
MKIASALRSHTRENQLTKVNVLRRNAEPPKSMIQRTEKTLAAIPPGAKVTIPKGAKVCVCEGRGGYKGLHAEWL